MWEGSLRGKVAGVTFQAEDGTFSIFRVIPDEWPSYFRGAKDIPVRFRGAAPKTGVHVVVEGRGSRHANYGLQLEAQSVEPQIQTRDGLLAYLSSGSLRGVGPTHAATIIAGGGEEVLKDHKRLALLKGFSLDFAKKVCAQWAEQADVRRAMVHLQGLGLGPKRAASVVARWKGETLTRLQENPYETLLAIRGIGFTLADAAALAQGVPPDSPLRLTAALQTACEEVLDERGDTLLTTTLLIGQAAQMTQQPPERIQSALDAMNDLVAVRQGDALYYSTQALHGAERRIAQALQRLRETQASTKVTTPLSHALNAFEQATSKTLSEEQRQAVALAIQEKVLIMTGGPGVGKTTTLFAILDIYKGARISLCSPTSRAAKRMRETTGREAVTIHSLLGVSGGQDSYRFHHHAGNPLPADVVVVDEASMLDAMLAKSLLEAIPPQCRLILVGDPDQLPSVSPGNVFADLIRSSGLPIARLTHIHRQGAGSQIAIQAARVNQGLDLDPQESGRDFFPILMKTQEDPAQGAQAVAQAVITVVKDRLPLKGFDPIQDVQVLTPMHKGACGTLELNAALQQALNPSGESTVLFERLWRVGDKVCQIKNNKPLNVANGEIGWIVEVSPKHLTVMFTDGQHVVYQNPDDLAGLVLGYAVTIHKSQGSEFKSIVMPIVRSHIRMLDQQILYTGMTRGKEATVMLYENRALKHGIATRTGRARLTALPFFLPGAPAVRETPRITDAAGAVPGF